MSDCTRCGTDLGLFHRGPLCDTCEAKDEEARLHEAEGAIAQIRASGGSDEAAKSSLARLLAAEGQGGRGQNARERTVRTLAIAAVEKEIAAALATDDPTGEEDARMLELALAVKSAVPEDDSLAKAINQSIQPHMLELQLREIRRGRLPTVQSVAIPLEGEEIALFEDHAELLEPSPVRGTKGAFASTRVRVSDDVWVRVGGFGAESSPKRVEMHSTDRGTLTVTTGRVVFIGAARTVQFERADVLTTVMGEPTVFAGPSITFHFRKRRNPVGFRLGPDAARLMEAILNYRPVALPDAGETASPSLPEKQGDEEERGGKQEEWWRS